MKLPHKVRITQRISYEVCFVERFDDPETRGECRFDTKQVLLIQGMPDSILFETYTHEVIHAIEHEYKIEIPHKSIYALEAAIPKILKLNRWMPK